MKYLLILALENVYLSYITWCTASRDQLLKFISGPQVGFIPFVVCSECIAVGTDCNDSYLLENVHDPRHLTNSTITQILRINLAILNLDYTIHHCFTHLFSNVPFEKLSCETTFPVYNFHNCYIWATCWLHWRTFQTKVKFVNITSKFSLTHLVFLETFESLFSGTIESTDLERQVSKGTKGKC